MSIMKADRTDERFNHVAMATYDMQSTHIDILKGPKKAVNRRASL